MIKRTLHLKRSYIQQLSPYHEKKGLLMCVNSQDSDNTQGIVAWTVFTMRVFSSVAFWLDWEDWSDCVDVQAVPSLPRWPFLMLWYVFQLKAMVMNSCWFILPEKMLVNSLFCCTRIFSALFIIKNKKYCHAKNHTVLLNLPLWGVQQWKHLSPNWGSPFII